MLSYAASRGCAPGVSQPHPSGGVFGPLVDASPVTAVL